MSAFASNLKSLMKYQNINQVELADKTGLTNVMINHYIHERKMPTVCSIVNISYALNVNVDELIDFGEMITK